MKALKGIRVLDLSRFQSGPVCGMMLGDMGAEVIRIEELGGAPDRTWGLLGPDGETLSYKVVGRSRKAITLNFNNEEGKKIFRELVKKSDVIIHNFTPGAPFTEELDYNHLRRVNSRIIVAAVSGFGQNGPDKKLVCFDHVAQARSGFLSLTGFPGDPPLKATVTTNDMMTGLFAAMGIIISLYEREKTGVGQFIDAALFDTAVFCTQLMGALVLYDVYGEIRKQVGNLGFHCYIGIFETKDKEWILISGATNNIWRRLTKAIGREDMASDPRFGKNDMVRYDNAKLIDDVIGEWVAQRTADEVLKTLQPVRVPCSIVNTVDRLLKDPQVEAREMIQYVDHPTLGKKIPLPNFPFKMSHTPGQIASRAPLVGEHNEEIYCGLLGFSKSKFEELCSKGIIKKNET
ncbi:MAG TPA: formyl-CoA transferase [Deltaproteobacteria bacterium]|nr:formyl-CoA transferase [Deltaproteobacteria bacterium]